MLDGTIAAITTAPGEGAIAIIRLSGPQALSIATQMFSGDVLSYASHTAHFGKILGSSAETLDEALLLVMHEGRSFTGEPTVEFMCHGGALIPKKVLSRSLELGARAAGPGEFSLRAFRNGRIDLAQAEAIQQLIAAKNEFALQAAEKQLSGRLSKEIKKIQAAITDVAAIIEAWVDYPEEGLEFASLEEIIETLSSIAGNLRALLETFSDGKRLSQNLSICILGLPNVGKSSFMNALLDEDRAIVTHIAGTTRDILQEDVCIGGMTFRLIDTAGIRETDEIVEKEGIKRTHSAAEKADIQLIILDVTIPTTDEEQKLMQSFPDAAILLNKVDLPHEKPMTSGFPISAKTGEGIDAVKHYLKELVWDQTFADKEAPILTGERHFAALNAALKNIEDVITGLSSDNAAPELLAFDLRQALHELAQIIGTNVTEDVLGAIFSKFCVGK